MWSATRWWTGDLQGAVDPLQAAVRLRPAHPEARYYLGATLRQMGEVDHAIEALREAVRLGRVDHINGNADPQRNLQFAVKFRF